MCLGGTYAWTVISNSICANFDVSEALARQPYTIFYSTFPLTVVFGSIFLKRLSPRIGAMLGGGLFGIGWMIASLGASNFWFTLIGAGVVGGIGVGIAYVIPISICIAWFPNRRGMVTGLIVGGFAGGAAIVSQVAKALTTAGTSPFEVLLYCGAAFLLFSLISGAFMIKKRPTSAAAPSHEIRFRSLIAQPIFRLLAVGMTIGLIAGFFVNVNLRQFASDNHLEMAMTGAAIFAIGNAFGRIIWGSFSDHCSAGQVLRLNLSAQAILIACAVFMIKSAIGMYIFAALTGFNYGGVLVLYASVVGKVWGNAAVGPVYSKIFISNLIAAWLMAAISLLYDSQGMLLPALIIAAILALTAFWSLKILPKAT